jgi:uncharacterized protein
MGSGNATLLVAPSLRFLLPSTRRVPELELPTDGTATVGHLLASVRVPRTEIGELRLPDRRVELSYRPRPGDRITVLPVSPPQRTPTSPPRFVLDVHLGALARRMRLLGLDTTYTPDADDDTLIRTSLTEQRVLLTRDRGILHRRPLRWGAHVNHQNPDGQLREVLERFVPPLHPWTRCPRCNGVLADVPKSQVEGELPEGTRRSYDIFRRCSSCGQVYWEGAHLDRLQAIVDTGSR